MMLGNADVQVHEAAARPILPIIGVNFEVLVILAEMRK